MLFRDLRFVFSFSSFTKVSQNHSKLQLVKLLKLKKFELQKIAESRKNPALKIGRQNQ